MTKRLLNVKTHFGIRPIMGLQNVRLNTSATYLVRVHYNVFEMTLSLDLISG